MVSKYSIKCTGCAAPLTLLGGGRVETITCSYCKSVLDLNDEYKVLSTFKNTKEKYAHPFDIGMKGRLKGVDYTIIGRVTYREIEAPFEEWSDFLLFSPIYGYAWLTYEQGHLLFSRRNRTFPSLSWDDTYFVENIKIDQHIYKPFTHYEARIIYVEGELTWVAKKGDKISFIDFIDPPYGLSAEKSKSEIEYYSSEYLDADEVYTIFGVPKERREERSDFNPLRPFSRPLLKSWSTVAMWVMVIWFFVFVGFLIDGSGKEVTSFNISGDAPIEKRFLLSSDKYLTTITLDAKSSTALDNYNITLYKEQKIIFSSSSNRNTIFDYKTQKVDKILTHWERKSKKVKIYLDLPEKGTYRIVLGKVDKSRDSTLKVSIEEGVIRVSYLLSYAFILLFFFSSYWFVKWKYKLKLKSESEIYGNAESTENFIDKEWVNYIFFGLFILLMIYFDD